MRESIHSLSDFNHDCAVMNLVLQLVLCHDRGGNVFHRDSHVFIPVHWGIEVKIFDVNRHECCVVGTHNTV